jgi:hypothetical protein
MMDEHAPFFVIVLLAADRDQEAGELFVLASSR